ncbi:SDR family NAD(P)-dependent oxidoreductase [Mycobacterium paraintracellulare]|uniref:SDR family NAD(P)-dependent oxidoreductase n=1 Tax=Mycobacterium paraintracellulare TaxID=1138383 RepID=UPI0019386CC2|nr:SDR family oxidoreductase [Mycobacterium paraintracellulare]BCP05399.1 short-chain dehydrogenase [Mycobacterium paraintracellulare]
MSYPKEGVVPGPGVMLDGRVALVTGAGQGVGRGIAMALADEGAAVAVVGRTPAKVEAVAAEIRDRGGQALAVGADVTRRADVDDCVAAVRAELGPLSCLVNAAQHTHYSSLRKLTEDDLDAVWQSGAVGSLRFMQACFDDLRSTRGCVINVGSGSGLTAQPAMGAYAAVKEAVRTMSRVAAAEWGRYGIRVNVICPLAESPGMARWGAGAPDAAAELARRTLLGRVGDAEHDIGRAVVFLAGPGAGYITGTTLMVDGGHDYLR